VAVEDSGLLTITGARNSRKGARVAEKARVSR